MEANCAVLIHPEDPEYAAFLDGFMDFETRPVLEEDVPEAQQGFFRVLDMIDEPDTVVRDGDCWLLDYDVVPMRDPGETVRETAGPFVEAGAARVLVWLSVETEVSVIEASWKDGQVRMGTRKVPEGAGEEAETSFEALRAIKQAYVG